MKKCRMEKDSSEEAMKMFNLINCIIVSNRDPVTPVILEKDFAELIGGQIPFWKFGFSTLYDLLAAWFKCSWIRGEVVIVPVITESVKEAIPVQQLERKHDFPVDSWLGSLHLSSATYVTKILESNINLDIDEDVVRLVDKLEIPWTVKNTVRKMIDTNLAERRHGQAKLHEQNDAY